MIIIVAAVGSAVTGDGYAISVTSTIMFWRLILGFGIGGDYPLSAIITSEFATKKRRGAMMAAVFAMQGFGILTAAIVALVVVAAFKNQIRENVMAVDYCWRLVLGLGAVPGLLALYFRLTVPETPRYTMDVERDVNQASKDITSVLSSGRYEERQAGAQIQQVEVPEQSWADFKNYFGQWKNGKVLLGTSMSWLTLDIAFYGIGLNNSIILNAIGFAKDPDPYTQLKNVAVGNIIITVMGTVPGYWFTVLLIDKWGRKSIQLMGFSILTILFIVLGAAYNQIKEASIALFIIFFTLLQVHVTLTLFFHVSLCMTSPSLTILSHHHLIIS